MKVYVRIPTLSMCSLQLQQFLLRLEQARQTTSVILSIEITVYIAATHNITHSSCTPSTTHHTAFHNPLHTTSLVSSPRAPPGEK